jgi:hypothetical protein
MWLGEFDAGDTVNFKFTTRDTTGTPTSLLGTPSITVYKGTTTSPDTSAIALTVDFNSKTGLNHVSINTGTTPAFYVNAADYMVVIGAGTVAGINVTGEVVGHFTLRNRSPVKPDLSHLKQALSFDNLGYALVDTAAFQSTTPGTGLAVTCTATINLGPDANHLIKVDVEDVLGSPAIGTDVWNITLPGAYAANTAGWWLGGNVALGTAGLDSVSVEAGITAGAGLTNDIGTQLTTINARQALALAISALSGVLSGASTTTITIRPAALPGGNARHVATVDASGNRSALTLKVPT